MVVVGKGKVCRMKGERQEGERSNAAVVQVSEERLISGSGLAEQTVQRK